MITTTVVDKLLRSFELFVALCGFCVAEKLRKQCVGEIERVGDVLPHMIHSREDFASVIGKAYPLCYRGMPELDSKRVSQPQKVLYFIELVCKVAVTFQRSRYFFDLITDDRG